MVAEVLATISAGMQAIDFYAKWGGSRSQVIQTLNLKYDPARFHKIEREVVSQGPTYEGVFRATQSRVQGCIDSFRDAVSDDQLPSERQKLGNSAKKCLCSEIRLLKDFMGDTI